MPDLHHLYCSSNLLCCNGLFVELTNLREFLRGTRRTFNLRRSHSLYRSGPPACQWFIDGFVAPGSPCRGKEQFEFLGLLPATLLSCYHFLGRSLFGKNGMQLFSRGAEYNIAWWAKNHWYHHAVHRTVELIAQAYRKAWDSVSAVNELFFVNKWHKISAVVMWTNWSDLATHQYSLQIRQCFSCNAFTTK